MGFSYLNKFNYLNEHALYFITSSCMRPNKALVITTSQPLLLQDLVNASSLMEAIFSEIIQ